MVRAHFGCRPARTIRHRLACRRRRDGRRLQGPAYKARPHGGDQNLQGRIRRAFRARGPLGSRAERSAHLAAIRYRARLSGDGVHHRCRAQRLAAGGQGCRVRCQEVWRIPPGGGTTVQFTKEVGDGSRRFSGDPSMSCWKAGQIRLRPTQFAYSGKRRCIRKAPGLRVGLIWGAVPRRTGGARMNFLNLHDRKPVALADLPRPVSPRALRGPAVAVSPDERHALYTATALDGGDRILIEGFR